MKAITKAFLIVFLLSLCSLFLPFTSNVYACDCARPEDPNEALIQATAVFSGNVLRVMEERYLEGFKLMSGRTGVLFEVNQVWKGVNESQVLVYGNGSNCQFDFREGNEYLVYADWRKEGQLYTSICSRTSELIFAADDIEQLGQSNGPTKRVNLESEPSPLTWGFGVISVSVVMWIVFIVFVRSIRG